LPLGTIQLLLAEKLDPSLEYVAHRPQSSVTAALCRCMPIYGVRRAHCRSSRAGGSQYAGLPRGDSSTKVGPHAN